MKYGDKVYGLRQELGRITDRREAPRIPTARITTALFFMLVARLGSLNAIEEALKKEQPRCQWLQWIGGPLPSADRLGEVAELVDPDDARLVLYTHHYKRKRNKTLPPLPGGLRVAIFDAHEMCSSYLRCCAQCLQRELTVRGEKRTQYYHRYVGAYLLYAGGRVMLDLEPQLPGEGEIAAAKRLFERLNANLPRAFNVVAGDALYLDPTLCRCILDNKKDFIAVLKNEDRELIKDFRGLVGMQEEAPATYEHKGKACACHDIEDLNTWTQLGSKVRVVSSEETGIVRRQATKEEHTIQSQWLWATSLSKQQASTSTILHIGHRRWEIENQGFNELVTYWHADHVYHHAPNAILVMLLLLFLAYNLFHVWLDRGLKPQARGNHTFKYFAQQIAAAFFTALRGPP